MKLKQFIFALVAMLSFAFSGFAQTVSTEADLKAALSSTGAVVTLGDNITMTETISIPSGVSVTLDLNGKNITTSAACDVFEVIGTMVINDSKGTGSVTGKTDRVLYVKTKGKLTINGGRFFKNPGRVVYSGGKLIINGGSVETTPVAIPNVNTAAITGAGGTVELNGGTVTSIAAQACDLKIAGATVEAGVNILKANKSTEITAGTINGDITVATEAADNVTISGGTFKDAEAVSEYMEEGKAVVKNEDGSYSVVDGLLKITSTGKCYPSLGDAFDAAVAGDVITLLDDVRVDDKYPTNQSKGITLDINGYTLSSYNNIHRVFDNGENGDITITNSKETGKIVGYSIRNKGQMKVQGVRLEFEDGLDCRGGDLYVDGCTIIGKKFAMQNDGGNTTVSNTTLSAETYAIEHRVYGASKTFTIGEGVVIESGKVHTYDIDPDQNIVFPEGYFAATIQKYQTSQFTRAYYYCALPAAVEAVKNGGTVQVLSDVELKDILTLDKAVTLDGNGKTLTSTAGRAINVDCAGEVTIENLTIAGATGCERGINIINKAGTTNLKKVNVSGVSYYAVHVATSAGAAQVNIENSNLTGWAAVAAYGENGTVNVKNSNLVGINNYTGNSDDFATVAAGSNVTVNVTGGKVTAESSEGKAGQAIVCGNSTPTTGVKFTLDTELELKGTAEYVNIDLDNNTVAVREEYGTNYVTTPAGNGLVTLTGASEAMIGDVKYSTIAQAFAAAKEGETITLIADVAPMLASQRAITKAAVIDLNGKTLTLNNADLYFGTTTFKNGTIVVAPSVNASTAVFWMFENQALAFDNVDIVATGVTGTYLIGINGGTGTTVDIINSSITIDNESKANLTAVICDNGTGNTVTIKDSDIDVKNIEGRLYLGGKNGAVVVENTDVDLDGVKEGFYLRAGQTLDIAGTSNVNVVLNSTEGRYGINVTDATAKYNKAETATVNATVFEKKGGNNFNGYTSADGIWGETWGNAKESFVIKVLDASGNVMGTTSLNNIDGIIDGDVNVTWSILFDAPTPNPAAYWSMEWTTAPSISNMPAKVELWVDGVKVSGGNVVLNGPDDLNKIVAAVTDADGKIISCHTSVANAAATNATNIALLRDTNEEIILPAGVKLNTNGFTAANVKTAVAVIGTQKFASLDAAIKAAKAGDTVTVFEGTYAVPSMKAGITIVGEGNVLFEGTLTGTLENLTMKNIHIKGGNAQRWAYAKGDLVFENVTFEATSVYALHFDGITEGTNLTYKNCTIIGWAAMGGSPASCVFEGCTIKGNGSYGLIRTYFDTTIKDCTFDVSNVNTTDAYEDGIHAVEGAKVVVDDCTNANGDMEDLVNVHATSVVTVDGTEYKNVAKVGDNYYATLVEAFAAVGDGAGKTVELIADVDLAGAEWTPVTFNGVFDGKDHTISNLVVNGPGKSNQGFFAQTQNGEIKNVTFHNAKVTGRLNVGVVAGTPYTSKYTNVKVTGHVEVNGMAYVGGVGGKNAYADWTNITVDVDADSYVKATSTENGNAYRTYVGGVIGFNGEGSHTFKNISSNIKVIGDVMDIGGIFGILHYGNNAENITFNGAVEAPANAKEVGGIAGVWHNEKGQTVTITNAESVGTVKVGDDTTTGSIVGGAYNANNVTPSTSGSLKVDDKEMWLSVAKIGDTTYRTLAEALTAADNDATVELLWAEGEAPIAMNGAVFGKNVTITGTAIVDWSKGFLFVGRGGEGNATVTFHGANLTSASNSASYGIHVSGREKGTNNKYDGTVVIKNSTIVLDYLINKGAMTLDKATLTVKNGFANGGRPASETESGEDATAIISLTNESKLVVNNHNGMGLGYEAIGVMDVDATSTFEATEDFLVTAKGTMNVNGGNVIIAGKLTNNGTVVVTGTGKSHLDVKNYSGNAIQLINGNLVDTYFAGRVDAFGTNNISGTTTIGGILSLGYGTNPTEQVVVNITGNFNGTNVLVYTNNGVDNILNVGKADGERTTVHFGQLGAFADVNVVNTDVTYGYTFIRNDFNAVNSKFEIKGGVNTYFSGNAKVVLDNTTWNLSGYANIGSYGGYNYGNADVTLKNGSSMTATNLGVEVSGEKVVKLTLEDSSSLTATKKLTNQGSIVLASTEATLTSNECGNVTTSVPNQVVVYNNGVYSLVAAVAQIGGTAYTSLEDAINAVKDGETVVLVKDFTGNITLTEKVGLHYTIDGAGKQFKGSISVNSLSDTEDNRRITIKDIKFVDDSAAKVDFITSVNTNHYPRLTVEGCTFTGSGDATDVALRLKSSHSVVITNCTGTGLHSFLQNTSGWNLTIDNVEVTESKGAFALGTVQGVTIKGSTIDVATYGIRLDANTYNNNAVIEGNNVTAFIPVVVRKVNTQSNVTFEGENTFTAENNDGKWMVIGTTEYEAGVALPAEVAVGNVVVALNGTKLSYDGVHGAGLAGEGTAEKPYLINNVAELEIFRNSVNAGSAKYSKPGLCVALNADIDMTGINWVGIGSMNADHGFMGNFDGKNFKIKNLTIENPALDSDGYAYAGLFALTEGTDKDNQNTIKNLTIENVTINTTGDIVSAAIAYAYYTIVENVKVCGNIAIKGGKYTAGVLAYTRRCVKASNLSIDGNEGSFVEGTQVVGGVISDIQMNGGLKAEYSNFSAKNIAVIGEQMVGGISGNIATQTLNGATVENVTLTSGDARVGTVAGCFGGTSTITDVTVNNVTGATAVIGATYNGAKAVEARIGDTYYETFAAAYTAAQASETVTMLVDLTMSEILVLDKAITLDGGNYKLTSTAARAINVSGADGVTIQDLIINATGERAINVIQGATNVTIDNVTATAANYTVNLAGSAGAAKVAINNSNLTGLNVVNVAAAGAEVTVNGGTITCNDQTDAESYAALVLNKDAVGAKIAANGVTFDIKGDSRKATNQAENGTVTIDGSTEGVEQHVAYISYGNNWYGFATLEAAIAKANAGETVTLLRDINASAIITIDKAITLDGNGKTLTSTAARAINVSGANGVTIKDLTINASGERAINVIQNATNVTIDGVTATAANYTVNIAGSAANAVVAIKNSTLNGLCTVNVSAEGAHVTVDNSTVNCNDNNTTAGEAYAALSLNKEAVGGSIVATNTTVNVAEGSDSMKGRNGAENGTVTINGSTDGVAVMVAVITYPGSDYYHSFSSLAEAVEFAKAGDVITLISDVTVAQPVVINKSVTLDGNSKTLTYTGTDRAIEMPNVADADYDVTIKNLNVVATTANRGLNYNDNGKLNVEGVNVTIGENVDGYAINFPGMADNAQVTIKDSKLTSRNPLNIWGENMVINVYDSEIISVENSSTYDYAAIQLNNDLYGNVANGTVVNVYGGTITALDEKSEPSNAVANSTETGVVNISNETVITGEVANYVANIGGAYFTSLQAAVNAIEKHGYNSPIVLMKSFSTSEATTIKSGLNVTINLNGKTITGTDNATGSFGLITNKGNLTINGEGAITLVATNDRDWNAYSSVISNTVGGKLTVNGGTIEHLGGTDMAYGIDNLTNGKGTYAETIINGGAVKSTYRAVRQFLNGTEAQNILTVNGGTIEGANKSIWMQDPSKNSNTGKLTVAADAKLTGDVYLSVTAGSTEWPVEVAVAAAALQGESKVLDNGNVPAGYDLALVDGVYGVYSGAAKIGTTYYATVDAAIKAAKAGETVNILAGTYPVPSMKAGITVEGAVNADGTPAVLLEGTLTGTLENLTLKNLHIKGGNAQRWAYAKGDLVFENVIFDATSVYALHFDGIAAGTNLTYNNCTIIGWAAMGGTPESCVFDGCTIKGNGTYGLIRTYFDAEIKDCTFDVSNVNTNDVYQDGIHAVEGAKVVVDGCTNENGTMKDLVNIHGTSEVTVDGIVYKNVAKVADKDYITIEDAFAAWADGTTLTLLTDIALDTKTLVTDCDGYASIVNVEGKAVTIDLNGKTITVNAAAADLANAQGGMLLAVFSVDATGSLTINDSSDDATGSVVVNANDAMVYSVVTNYADGAYTTINGGKFVADKVHDSMIYSGADNAVKVYGGTFLLGNVGTGSNGKPWIFNGYLQNETNIEVYGGTYNADINHQYWAFEVQIPSTLAVKDNGNGTWTVVDAVASVTEIVNKKYDRVVGYSTIEEAIAALAKSTDGTVTMVADVAIENTIKVAAEQKVVLDLNGKVIRGTDNNTSGNFYLIDNCGELTITDSSEEAEGKITLVANTDRQWNASSVVVANNTGGKLTVWDGTIEHLGGTSMAYGIDNLTNGKGTYAETTINGGTVNSAYIAVRQFLNGVEANNALAVYGGTLDGKYSIFFQDPSTKANSGTLYVDAEAALNASVYLGVTEGSTEWPVEVEIAKAALKGESTVVAPYVPATYYVTEYPAAWIVECSELDKLTIDEADYAETGYINLVEKNVAELTYVREFENTGWQSLYLPFGFTITEEMAAEFEFAYIYNASYKNKETAIDYVEVGAGFELAANYPYMIRAKEAGEKVIVVENAVLEVTKNETIDCSSVFEKFTFAGNYAANFAPEASAKMKFFALDGEWSKLDTLNPFRFYLQIELRNGSAFPAEAQNIRMRSVNAYGEETTGINGVDAEQAGDFIFDIHGRRVLETEKGGIYIKNGKKFIAQ